MERGVRRGFSLAELLAALVVLGLLLIAFKGIGAWIERERVSSDVNKIYTLVSAYRVKALNEEKEYAIAGSEGEKEIAICEGSSCTKETAEKIVSLNNPLKSDFLLKIGKKGTSNRLSICLDTPIEPNCVIVSNLSQRIGSK